MKLSMPTISRTVPFLLFILLLMGAHGIESLQETGRISAHWDLRWLYGLRVIIPALALWYFWRQYTEIRSPLNLKTLALSIGVGLAVFVLWIHLTASWMLVGTDELSGGFNALTHDQLDWPLIILRLVGAAAVVPIIEELFWRSFVMRVIDKPADFLSLSPQQGSWMAFLVSSAIFAVEHQQWLAGFIAGIAYAGIYRYTGQLKTAIIAHAVTNLALGIWVVATHSWHFW